MQSGLASIEATLTERGLGVPATTARSVAPLREVRAYADGDDWLYVTFGLTELDGKVSSEQARSGWGFELTLRLVRRRDEREPPAWPNAVLRELARYVFETRNPFGQWHHIDLGAPLDDATPALRGVAFCADAELGPIDTPNGALMFSRSSA